MPRWADLAFAAADALKRTAWRDGRLLATRRGDRADLNAYLDDHAFLLAALVELMQARFRREDLRLGARARRRAARALRGPRARRLLLHEPRPRDAVPPHEARPRQRDAVGQRRRGAGAGRVRPSRGASRATSRPRERTVRLFAADVARVARRAIRRCSKPPRRSSAADLGAAVRAIPQTCAQWQRALAASYRPGDARAQPVGRARPAAGARQRRSAGRGRRGVRLPRHDLPAAASTRRSTTCRDRARHGSALR